MKDGFTVTYKGEHGAVHLLSNIIDRSDKKMDRLLTGRTFSCYDTSWRDLVIEFVCYVCLFALLHIFLIAGVGDGCESCLTLRELWIDTDAIKEGFEMNRMLGEPNRSFWLFKLWTFLTENVRPTRESLPRNAKGEILQETVDYLDRQGVCTCTFGFPDPKDKVRIL